MAAKKLPVEDQVLKLIAEGVAQAVVAARVKTTENHVWAIKALAGVPRPVSEGQREMARKIVTRKRLEAAR